MHDVRRDAKADDPAGLGLLGALFGSALALATILLFKILRDVDEGLYFRLVQEDEILEWATFWAFLFAAGAWGFAARRQWRLGRGFSWAQMCLALFCLLVALEEISWGQRLLSYRPPVYFLEHNEQLELNFHNVLSATIRDVAFVSLVTLYGIFLPFYVGRASRRQKPWAKVVPPVALVPVFLATLIFYVFPQWPMMQEIVELTLGQGFLYVTVGVVLAGWKSDGQARQRARWEIIALLVVTMAVASAGAACAALQRAARRDDVANITAARIELDTIRRDFLGLLTTHGQSFPESAGFEQRLYTFVVLNRERSLERGAFAQLTERGMPPERAHFFLDPWNSSYWIRDHYSADRESRTLAVYSLGPNCRRDSTPDEIRGDDLLTVILSE